MFILTLFVAVHSVLDEIVLSTVVIHYLIELVSSVVISIDQSKLAMPIVFAERLLQPLDIDFQVSVLSVVFGRFSHQFAVRYPSTKYKIPSENLARSISTTHIIDHLLNSLD